MATLIDSLIVSLGLDAKDFEAGQKKAAEAFLKTRKAAQDDGKRVEQAAKGMSDGISGVTRRVLELYALFLGGKGLKEFVSGLVSGDAALGRFSANLGMSPQLVSGWQMAVERMGGTGAAVAGTMERLGKALYDMRYNGKGLPKEFFQLEQLANLSIPTDRGLPAYMNAMAEALKRVYAANPARAHFLAQGLGIDDSTFNLMVKMGGATGAYVESLKNLAPTKEAIKAAQDLQASWATLEQNATSLGNALLSTLGPQLAKILQQMTDWINKNHDWLMTNIVDAVHQFATWIASIDWVSVGKGLSDFGDGAMAVVHAVGDIQTATELLFALWLGSKFLAVLANAKLLGATLGLSALPLMTALGAGAVMNSHPGILTWMDKYIPGSSWLDNFGKKYLGIGRSYGEQAAHNAPSGTMKARAQESYDFWRSKGLDQNAALAMVGNEQGESGLDPHPTGGDGVGSFQWHSDRVKKIYDATGINVADASTTHKQMLEAAYAEMSMGLDAGAGAAWKTLNSPGGDTRFYAGAAVNQFERSLNRDSDTAKRTAYANQWGDALSFGAKGAAAINNGGRNVQVTHGVQIGTMIVNSAASNAAGISGDIHGAINNQKTAASANTGMF